MQIIPLNLDSVLLLLHNSKLAVYQSYQRASFLGREKNKKKTLQNSAMIKINYRFSR